jgi:uncharacterized protein (DUF983 family)
MAPPTKGTAPASAGWRSALLRGLCPACRSGRIFCGFIAMNEECGDCGLAFHREPGYFTGAMYVSYAMSVPALGLASWIIHLAAPGLSFAAVAVLATLACLPLVPFLFRWSRIVWIHFDRWMD